MTLFFQQDDRSPFPDYWTLPYSSPRTSPGIPVQKISLKYQCAMINFFTAKPFIQPRTINCSLLSTVSRDCFHTAEQQIYVSKNTRSSSSSSSRLNLTSMFLLPVTSAPSHPRSYSCHRPWSLTGQSLWSWSLHRRCHSPTGCYLSN